MSQPRMPKSHTTFQSYVYLWNSIHAYKNEMNPLENNTQSSYKQNLKLVVCVET